MYSIYNHNNWSRYTTHKHPMFIAHTFIGPFLRHPTPNNDCPLLRVSSKLIFVAVSINAAAAVTVGILLRHI